MVKVPVWESKDHAMAENYHPTSAAAEREWSVLVPLAPQQAIDSATPLLLAERFSLESRTENSATFFRDRGPNVALGCLLMLFFILPGLLYLLLGSNQERVTLLLVPEGNGSRAILGGDSVQGRAILREWAESIHRS
jgi:hypothetical protein